MNGPFVSAQNVCPLCGGRKWAQGWPVYSPNPNSDRSIEKLEVIRCMECEFRFVESARIVMKAGLR